MSALAMTVDEARADPAHRLWFAFVDAVAAARASDTDEAWRAADAAAEAFRVDFMAQLAAEPTRRRA